MIEKLRKKFVGISMLSITLVLGILMGSINVANFSTVAYDADVILDVLAENGGHFAEEEKRDPAAEGGDLFSSFDDSDRFSDETPYESRYFFVLSDENGERYIVDTANIAAVETEDAIRMAQTVAQNEEDRGYIDRYRYRITETPDGQIMYLFLDRQSALSSATTFFLLSVLVSFAGILAFFLLVNLLSRSVFAPVARSYDKQKKFITDAGHELKTPLAIIDSCADVLEMENGESKWTDGIHDQVDRLSNMTKELITMAKMDESDMDLDRRIFNLTEAAKDTWAPFALMAEEQGLKLRMELAEEVQIIGNERSIRQVLSILADNALKYALPETEVVFKLVRNKRNSTVRIITENKCEPLKKGNHEEFFDRFYRADESRNSGKFGYGIGLSMAYTVVQSHHGKISAYSEDGNSLRMTVVLSARVPRKLLQKAREMEEGAASGNPRMVKKKSLFDKLFNRSVASVEEVAQSPEERAEDEKARAAAAEWEAETAAAEWAPEPEWDPADFTEEPDWDAEDFSDLSDKTANSGA